jgi:hypothetical protein
MVGAKSGPVHPVGPEERERSFGALLAFGGALFDEGAAATDGDHEASVSRGR